jgi:hypothetical protein
MVPLEWRDPPKKLLIQGYRIFGAPITPALGPGPFSIDLGGARIYILWGKPKYLASDGMWEVDEPNQTLTYTVTSIRTPVASEGRYALLLTPASAQSFDSDPRARLAAARGFLCAYHGRNAAFDRVFEYEADGDWNFVALPSLLDPTSVPPPRLAKAEINSSRALAEGLDSKPESERSRLHLSLRWVATGLDRDGADAFLSYWIAIETLAMPDTANIRPVNEALGRAYELSRAAAATEFRIGRLADLRARIVHGGSLERIPASVLMYMGAVYVDLLNEMAGRPCEQRARNTPGGIPI